MKWLTVASRRSGNGSSCVCFFIKGLFPAKELDPAGDAVPQGNSYVLTYWTHVLDIQFMNAWWNKYSIITDSMCNLKMIFFFFQIKIYSSVWSCVSVCQQPVCLPIKAQFMFFLVCVMFIVEHEQHNNYFIVKNKLRLKISASLSWVYCILWHWMHVYFYWIHDIIHIYWTPECCRSPYLLQGDKLILHRDKDNSFLICFNTLTELLHGSFFFYSRGTQVHLRGPERRRRVRHLTLRYNTHLTKLFVDKLSLLYGSNS